MTKKKFIYIFVLRIECILPPSIYNFKFIALRGNKKRFSV